MLDTILSAIHNVCNVEPYYTMLFMICVRYDFVSYSQPVHAQADVALGCLWYVLDTILSAIHNANVRGEPLPDVVYDMC